MSQQLIDREQVLDLIDEKCNAYQWAKDHAGTDHDRRKYQEGLEALLSLSLEVQGLHRPTPAPEPTPTAPHFVKCEAGSYNLVEDGVATYSVMRTEPGDWFDHNPEHPWVIVRRYPSGSQVEARCKTLAAAKKWLLG